MVKRTGERIATGFALAMTRRKGEAAMEMPKLRPRPVSHQTCTNFRGIDRRPGASSKYYNKRWHMGWHDERNLSSDRYPRMSVRPARGQTIEIDNNWLEDEVIGMCGGDRVLILDASGNLWCNGNSIYLAGQDGQVYSWKASPGPTGLSVIPDSRITGATADDDVQSVLWDAWNGHRGTATLVYDPANAPDTKHWHFVEGDEWVTMLELGLVESKEPKQGDSFTIDFYVSCTFGSSPSIIRMGAYAIIYPGWIWCNAVKLANGDELVEGTDYGPCEGLAYLKYGESALTLTLCDIDGNPYSGVVVSATEPTQEGYWLDTSGSAPVLREWSVSQTIWVSIASTYVRISKLEQEPLLDTLRKGDAVTVSVDCAAGTDDEVVKLLNSDHYLYDADLDDQNGGWVMVSGILPSNSVTVTIANSGEVRFHRKMPTLDFLVEAGNRLWGCRYSEEDELNEIYGSKLGDFKNWNVYQGLSTDSWAASRGTAAPFTGAITLSGNPLFFREDSLEKIFPSAAGAHQIATYSLEGVQQGSHGSMVVIDERLYYKSRMGICVYSGTLPARISEEFGDWEFQKATAARHRRKYAICMSRPPRRQKGLNGSERLCMVYDLETGDWHVEDECWDGIAITWEDKLYYVKDGDVYRFEYGSDSSAVTWFAESDDMSLELPEHKWITYLRLRFQLEMDATCRVYVSYDSGPWLRKGTLHGNRLHTQELGIRPSRCDHFRLRLEGTGGCELQSISYAMESSQLKH